MENKKNAIIIFLLLGIIWGSNFIYMKWASELITPLQVVFLRVLFGFIPVLVYAYYKKAIKIEHLKYSFHFFVMSLLGTTVYYYFFVKATSLLLSGVTGALSGSIPLFAFILAVVFLKDEKFDKRIVGILVGILGVILIAKPFEANIFESNLEGIMDIILGSLIVGSSFVYAKKFVMPLKIHFSALTTYQLGFALLTLLVVTKWEGISNITTSTHVFLGTVVGLGLLGTGLAFVLYYYIIEHLGAVTAASTTYLPPVVALIIGYFFIGEDIDLIDCLGTVLIFIGVFIVNKRK
ncbi:DMT family transporter [Halarcobacter ebronensis]|uniref:EamA family transporter n=1 Tax=Halarcobacter ebronensis TaxID=1462615 RepID=A0A4Q1AYT1_9BACT|nr:DMT family transporter [Halarcobacter ebronensis]QKF80768.1 EamA/RhaT family transporter [Halarcobacter ebronensis]RXK08561.1 EamA family transporter [Halarcobacter ebronensis]